MANLMDLIREVQGVQNQTAPIADPNTVGRGYDPEVDGPTVEEMGGVYEPGIQVDGAVPRPRPVDQSQYLLSAAGAPDLRNTEWAQAAVDAREANDKEVKHKGMFGMKGTLRNVLGVLGDAFLVQGGAKPVYAPQRERERMGDAMAGYTQAPRAAVERMTAVNPEFAQEMGDAVARQELARAQQESIMAQRKAAIRDKGVSIVGGLLGAEGMANQETYTQMRPIIDRFIDQYDLRDLYGNLPEQYDPNLTRALNTGAMNPYQQAQDENTDERTELTAQRNQALSSEAAARLAETRRANQAREAISRSKGGPKGSTPTEAGELARIRGKVDNGTPLKPGEQATWNRYINGTPKPTKGGTTRRPVTQASRFRPVG